MRVIAGELRGRRLAVPRGGVRPTSDRVREALFTRLGALEDARVLDLYAGTGALGIEALSRGARSAVFIDRAAASCAALGRNLDSLSLTRRSRVVRADLPGGLRRLGPDEAFELVFADPPYAAPDLESVLEALVQGRRLAPDAVLVVERSRRHPLASVPGLGVVDERRYGDTVITRLRRLAPGAGQSAGEARPPGAGRNEDRKRDPSGAVDVGGRSGGRSDG